MLKTFFQPWEEQNPDPNHKGIFYEMFFNHFSQDKLEMEPDTVDFLTAPIDEGTPSFQKTLKQIFRDLFDLTGQAKLKASCDIIENFLYAGGGETNGRGNVTVTNPQKLIVCAFHQSFLTSLEDFLTNKQVEFLFLGKNVSSEFSGNICA